ncbi:hypothetical protein GGI04_001269 [Coemansia thaxteri]|nr:hypothetical protein GGI04_001269 [Coemansia thaxteri]KAJ2472339.1 hypothetical protein GGI02_001651 [Coemansia sp. RSA 2322]
MAIYTLRYFGVIGYGETSRLLLTAANVDWNEENPEWPAEKPNQPFGRLPVLIEKRADGKADFVLSESGTIERYLARTFGFLPADLQLAAQQEQLRDVQMDVLLAIRAHMMTKEDLIEETTAKLEQLLDKLMSAQTELLRQNGNTGRLFGSTLSYADISAYAFLKLVFVHLPKYTELAPKMVKAKLTPEIAKLASTVEADPLLAAHTSTADKIASLVAV